ncbi:MAG: type II secretion system protein [Oscillospiraceae bacterium]|nr:type II secretion system protein [Oscillospiraceae bacterium]
MNKKNNRKGFTTVELVIVIAVIAILATVLIPTFSNLITDAKESANLSDANSLYKSWLANNAEKFTNDTVLALVVGDAGSEVVYLFENNQLNKEPETAGALPCGTTVVRADGTTALPDGFTVAPAHKDEPAADAQAGDGKCDICGEDMPA